MARMLEVLLTPAVRERLRQGQAEPGIANLLGCDTVEKLRAFLVPAVLRDTVLVGAINRYLKRVVIKKVRLTEFKPTTGTIERDQINAIAEQFRQFLAAQLASIGADGDTLPMLQVVD